MNYDKIIKYIKTRKSFLLMITGTVAMILIFFASDEEIKRIEIKSLLIIVFAMLAYIGNLKEDQEKARQFKG